MELIPGVSRNVWRENDPRATAADLEYRAKRPRVLATSFHTCQFCGVHSPEGIEVHHYDCNHANNSDPNLKLACVFCHPVHHLGELAQRFTRVDQSEVAGGMVNLSFLPDLSQADLSHLLRTIGHVLQNGSDEEKADAQALYEQLLGYSSYVEAVWGTSKASHFAIAMREASDAAYAARGQPMKGVRVIFSLDAVRKLGSKFANQFAALPIRTWENIYQRRRPQTSP